MSKKTLSLLLATVCIAWASPIFAQTITTRVVDIETGMAVPYVTVQSSDKSIAAGSREDGIISFELRDKLTYTFSQIGYKNVSISSEQLLTDPLVQMEAQPFELSPVVVKADVALRDIYRAIDSSYKHIQPFVPLYLRCFKNDVLHINEKMMVHAKAIIDIQAKELSTPGHNIRGKVMLKGLNTYKNEDYVTTPDLKALILPISLMNSYIVGVQKREEHNFTFTRLPVEGDSIIIISYHPKNSYQYSGSFVYKSGRFIIDAKTWVILRLDWALDNKAKAYQNSIVEKSKKQEKWKENTCSIFFSAKGIPLKLEQTFVYSLKDNPDEVYTWTTSQVYRNITQHEYKQGPAITYNHSKFILQQKPIAMPDNDFWVSQ